MIRISDFSSLVKTFFKNIFSFRLPFEQQFKLFVSKTFETLFRVYVKRVDDAFFHSDERKDKFKSKGFVKRTVTTALNVANMQTRKQAFTTTLMKKLGLSGTEGFLRS